MNNKPPGPLQLEDLGTILKSVTFDINQLRRWRIWPSPYHIALANLLFKLGIKSAQ